MPGAAAATAGAKSSAESGGWGRREMRCDQVDVDGWFAVRMNDEAFRDDAAASNSDEFTEEANAETGTRCA